MSSKTKTIKQRQDHDWFQGDTDERMENYSKFLHDGDFELFQPVCYINQEAKDSARENFTKELTRALWIRMRLCVINSKEHQYYSKLLGVEFKKLV